MWPSTMIRTTRWHQGTGYYQLPQVTAEFVTASLSVKNPRFYINADGLSEDAALRIVLLDHLERPIPGYATRVTQSGFQTPIEWGKAGRLPDRVRLHVIFEGPKRAGIRLSAIYVK